MTEHQKKYVISEDVLYNKCYLHGYNRKVWETMDPVVMSVPYLTPDEIIGLLPVPGNMGFEGMSINNDLSKEEILAYNRLKLNRYIGEQRLDAVDTARKQVLDIMAQLEEYISNPQSLENHHTAWSALRIKIENMRKRDAEKIKVVKGDSQ